jgi:inorganic triphosphatase YgiF
MDHRPDNLPQETEITLRIRSPHRAGTIRQLADLTSLAAFRLVAHPGIVIRDQYLDTTDRALSTALLALRLRTCDDLTLITLKGPPTSNPDGSKTRLELEHVLSPDAITAIIGVLESYGILLPDLAPAPLPGQGLVVIQDRETTRSIRSVFPAQEDTPVAELVIDQVTYRPHGEPVHHAELEIELGDGGDPAALATLSDLLLREFKNRLSLWDHGKLAIGEAIDRLTTPREPDYFLNDDRGLTEKAYEAIEAFLG